MSTVFIIYNTVVRKIDHVMLWLSTRSTKCYIVGYMHVMMNDPPQQSILLCRAQQYHEHVQTDH